MIRSVERWVPLGARRTFRTDQLEEGQMVGIDLVAWRILHVHHTDEHGPGSVLATMERVYGPEREYERELRATYRVGAAALMVYPSERIPLCSCCGHPAPCFMELAEKDAEAAIRRYEILEARVQPGCCYACAEPVTQRQKVIVMPEDNIDVPGAPPPVFHLRYSCYPERTAYLERRNKALPDVTPITEDSLHQEGTS